MSVIETGGIPVGVIVPSNILPVPNADWIHATVSVNHAVGPVSEAQTEETLAGGAEVVEGTDNVVEMFPAWPFTVAAREERTNEAENI